MKNTITVEEQTHRYWQIGTYSSAGLCVLFFILFQMIDSPFWGGISRLVSFIFFALAVLGMLNMMSSALTIILHSTEEHLIVTYQKNDETIHEEQFDRKTIKKVVSSESQKNIVNSLLQPNSATLKCAFTDTDKDLFLIEFGGRPLFFDQQTITRIKNFLAVQKIETT